MWLDEGCLTLWSAPIYGRDDRLLILSPAGFRRTELLFRPLVASDNGYEILHHRRCCGTAVPRALPGINRSADEVAFGRMPKGYRLSHVASGRFPDRRFSSCSDLPLLPETHNEVSEFFFRYSGEPVVLSSLIVCVR